MNTRAVGSAAWIAARASAYSRAYAAAFGLGAQNSTLSGSFQISYSSTGRLGIFGVPQRVGAGAGHPGGCQGPDEPQLLGGGVVAVVEHPVHVRADHGDPPRERPARTPAVMAGQQHGEERGGQSEEQQ